MVRVKTLKILNLDGCVHITDAGLKHLLPLADQLEVLSLAGCIRISDNGLEELGKASVMLKLLKMPK